MRNPVLATTKGIRTMEASLQQFAKGIRTNIQKDDADYKAGKVGANARNPFRKPN